MQNEFNLGRKCLTPAAAAEKLGRKKTWLYDKLKSDPTFPRPFTLGDKSGPVFLEHELDAWITTRAQTCRADS